MAEPIVPIGDFVPELTGSGRPSRLRSMQDNIPEDSPRGGTATLERPKLTDRAVLTQSLEKVENEIIRDELIASDERIEAEDVETEDLKREYKALRKLGAFWGRLGLVGENDSRALDTRRMRLVHRLKHGGMNDRQIEKYLVKVDEEVTKEMRQQIQEDNLDELVRKEKGYTETHQVSKEEREAMRKRAAEVEEEPLFVEELDQNGKRVKRRVSTGGISGEDNDRRFAQSQEEGTGSMSSLDTAIALWKQENGREPSREEKWQILGKLRDDLGLRELGKDHVAKQINELKRDPGRQEELDMQKEAQKQNRDMYGRLPSSMQEWLGWVMQKQDQARYGPQGTTPLYILDEKGNKIIQPQNVLEWFREQMLDEDDTAGDENAVDFWKLGVPMPNGSIYPIIQMRKLPESFFRDGVNDVVLKDLMNAMVFEVWQANAARNLFQVNDFLKENDEQFFGKFAEVMMSNFLTKPTAINIFALSGVSPTEKMDPMRLAPGGKGFENQQTGQAIRAALLTYGYLGDIDTLKQIWGTSSALMNNKEFVKSYHKANWDKEGALRAFDKLSDAAKKEAIKSKFVADAQMKVVDKSKYDQLAVAREFEASYNKMSDDDKKNAYLYAEELKVINKGREEILLADAKTIDLDDITNNAYNKSRPENIGTVGANTAVNLEIDHIYNPDGSIKKGQDGKYIEHFMDIFREAIPFEKIRNEVRQRIVYSLTQGGQVMVDNPDYNPRFISKNGQDIENPDFDGTKPENAQAKVTQFDQVSLTSAKYGVRLGMFLEPLWLHSQDPSGRAQRAGAKLTRRERNAARAGNTVRLGTPGNIHGINTMKKLGMSPLIAIPDDHGYSIAERLRGSDKGKVNINLRRKIDAQTVIFKKDASKAWVGDHFNRGSALWKKNIQGSLYSAISGAVKRDFFQGLIVDHHKMDELFNDGIGKYMQYFLSTYGGIDYSKDERLRDETEKGEYVTKTVAEHMLGYDVLDRDKYHMKVADGAYMREIYKRVREKYADKHLSEEDMQKKIDEEVAKLPRNKDGEILIHDGKKPDKHASHDDHGHKEVAIQQYGDREKFGTYKWEVINETLKDHKTHDPKLNPYGQEIRIKTKRHMIDTHLVQNVDRNLLWKEALKAEIVNSLIEHRNRATGHEYFDWEASARIIDLLRYIPANPELDPITGKYHWHDTLFSKEDVDWIQKKSKMNHLMLGELGKKSAGEGVMLIMDLLGQLASYTFK